MLVGMRCRGWVLVIASALTLNTACNEPPAVTLAAIPARSSDPVADPVDAGVRIDTAPPDAGATRESVRILFDSGLSFGPPSAPFFGPHETFTSAQACARVASLPEVKAQGATHIVAMTDQAESAGGYACTGSAYECVHWCRVDRGQGDARRPWRYYGAKSDRLTGAPAFRR
jgi:hypothetical protein